MRTPCALPIGYTARDTASSYMGVDQYFGSWQPGDVDSWTGVIDGLYERYGLPVLANEWGYSSDGELALERPDMTGFPEAFPDVCVARK